MAVFPAVLSVMLATVTAVLDPFHDVQPSNYFFMSMPPRPGNAFPVDWSEEDANFAITPPPVGTGFIVEVDNHIFTLGVSPEENTTKYWRDLSMDVVHKKVAETTTEGEAKNLILFLGDGMSLANLAAARIYLGQLKEEAGENSFLSFEKFPYTGFAKTYCVDSQVADSACSATAYLSGVKGNIYTLGVTSAVGVRDWVNMKNESYHTTSILKWAQDAGKSTGIVSTARITDASPAATYAHSAYRKWQTDLDIKNDEKVKDPTGVKDIASQLIENSPGNEFKVILGGGWDAFLPNKTEEDPAMEGARGDDKDLIQKWTSSKKKANKTGVFINKRDQLQSLDVNNTDYVLGLFQPGNMKYHKLTEDNEQPTLSEMTELAIEMLQKDANGFVLFIEGGLIDIAHHENKAHLALDETVELHKAVEVALKMTHENETLIVVTADHAHTLNINGYPKRGGHIFTYLQATKDHKAYSTLSYANGPNTRRFDTQGQGQYSIVNDYREKVDYTFQTINLLPSGTHDGQDVTVFANGPWAHLLVGNYEQTAIPYVMGYAAEIGPAAKAFNRGSK